MTKLGWNKYLASDDLVLYGPWFPDESWAIEKDVDVRLDEIHFVDGSTLRIEAHIRRPPLVELTPRSRLLRDHDLQVVDVVTDSGEAEAIDLANAATATRLMQGLLAVFTTLQQAPTTSCPTCSGELSCPACNGEGCNECEELGTCPECRGIGRVLADDTQC
jgi:hypothetical protein